MSERTDIARKFKRKLQEQARDDSNAFTPAFVDLDDWNKLGAYQLLVQYDPDNHCHQALTNAVNRVLSDQEGGRVILQYIEHPKWIDKGTYSYHYSLVHIRVL